MKMIVAAMALSLVGTLGALADEKVIIGAPGVVVEHRSEPTVVERRSVETTSSRSGCESKTVTKTNDDGDSKTVRKERCD